VDLVVSHRTRQVTYIHSSFTRPPEIYRLELDDGQPQALTALNAGAAAASQLRTDKVSFTLAGGATRDGYLIQPAAAPFPPRDVPIVVYQPGGPGGAMTNRWAATPDDPASLLPNFGIGVLFMPFSGREGYGPAFLNALADGDNFGALDIDEAAEVVRAMIEQGYTSPGRIGITGGSYGGYFASQSIVRHPGLYGAANPQCPLLDLRQWWQTQGRAPASYMEGRTPETNPAEYEADSPISGASKVRTPLLLFHGTEDFLPLAMVEQFRDQVAAGGIAAELMTFRGEGHCLTEPDNLFDAAQAQIDWFRRHLQVAAKP
jgi:dipeptidyl aminopeptidase/acylaminoacyl peptidase